MVGSASTCQSAAAARRSQARRPRRTREAKAQPPSCSWCRVGAGLSYVCRRAFSTAFPTVSHEGPSAALRETNMLYSPARRVGGSHRDRDDAGGPGSLRQNLRLNSRVRRICQSPASNAPQEPAAAFEWHIAQGLPRRHMATTTRARMTVVRRSATRSSYSTHQDRAPWCPLASKTTLVLSRACTTWRRIAQFTGSMATCLVPMQRTCQPTLFGTSTLRARPGRPTPPNGCGS